MLQAELFYAVFIFGGAAGKWRCIAWLIKRSKGTAQTAFETYSQLTTKMGVTILRVANRNQQFFLLPLRVVWSTGREIRNWRPFSHMMVIISCLFGKLDNNKCAKRKKETTIIIKIKALRQYAPMRRWGRLSFLFRGDNFKKWRRTTPNNRRRRRRSCERIPFPRKKTTFSACRRTLYYYSLAGASLFHFYYYDAKQQQQHQQQTNAEKTAVES